MIRNLLKSVLTLVFVTVLITPALGESRLQRILANGAVSYTHLTLPTKA